MAARPLTQTSPFRGLWLKVFGLTIAIYAITTVVWEHYHLNNRSVDVSAVLSSTKDAFMGSGTAGNTMQTDTTGGRSNNRVSTENAIKESTGVTIQESGNGSIVPIDLSVNFLKLITKAPGAPPEPPTVVSASKARVAEDFLPVVVQSEIVFRWAHQAKEGAVYEDILSVRAYRVVVRQFDINGNGAIIWDTDRVDVKKEEGVPSVPWKHATARSKVGQILEWRVIVWDASNKDNTSTWSKFAVGPEKQSDWRGEWIVHPSDMDTFDKSTEKGKTNQINSCAGWKLRRPLPLFRMKVLTEELATDKQISSALFVVSGLGSFRASLNGVPLSTSGPIDPPFTDYSKRVMYRGFDVTPFLTESTNGRNSHVFGITMGSGWWDHRPVSGMAKPQLLPRGPATVNGQLIITYASGEQRIIGETGKGGMNKWQAARGHIRESDLFTGEMVDLDVMSSMEGWDTSSGWAEVVGSTESTPSPYEEVNKWIKPVPYRTDVTLEQRVQEMAIKAKAMDRAGKKEFPKSVNSASPIGYLVPSEIPPVMSVERIAPDEIQNLGGGRWLIDYGKAMSGMIHFDEGLPEPIVPDEYPRAHGFKAATANGDSFITVIYGESLEMTTGDINRVLVAGLGLHDGGPRHKSKSATRTAHSFCFPDDHEAILSQRDVYVIPKESKKGKALYAEARQSHFTTHSFRYAEICCTAEPPKNAHALLYRTAIPEWGTFDSSNVLINGGYELVKNAMNSNLLSVQSDCPHREKLPYGGDLVADSPAALHMYDMSAFYKKTVNDWLEAQWDNGAYTETSIWQDLNDYAGIGHGAGETVWASAPPVLTVRHMQHYGDITLLQKSISHHVKWLDFLDKYFDAGMEIKGYDKELDEYTGQKSGLGDWLAMRSRDTYLTHTAFVMASGRCVAYIGRKVGLASVEDKGMAVAKKIQDRLVHLYMKNGKDNFDFPLGSESHTPGPEMGLYTRIVPGEKRCIVLKNWFRRSGHTWPGDEERLFIKEMSEEDKQEWIETKELTKRGDEWAMGWSQWQGFNEGIFAIRYAMKTLSDMGYHNIALRKAAGVGMATPEYMMSHNATTMWESWWRSEDLYSRNHPMLGAVAEWMSSSAAGVALYPTTTGGKKALFWPRFPKSATTLEYASAVQGSLGGDYAIAWRFEELPSDKSEYNSAVVKIRIRLLIPPGNEGVLRLPLPSSESTSVSIRHSLLMPNRKESMGETPDWESHRYTM
ncbi:predicted protein [Thalassiosira pseudonana CCMP1335]|uniref:alpha-L-rhamnosidase n=1 Tax=Thalassiosira pseudonana TaxID=35128 RepID=B8BXH5_THAPS|nr:predicted protein [Thalassiosira pseudonana CCMP1335]EED93707.1 predicted protein [Thalassiosira pseudonana CCMP1335]